MLISMNNRDCLALAEPAVKSNISSRIVDSLVDSSILITGATGFVGRNLLFLLECIRNEFGIKYEIDILKRANSPSSLIAYRQVGEVVWNANEKFFLKREYDYVFHLANDNSNLSNNTFNAVNSVSFKILESLFASLGQQEAKCSFNLASSGAVYGHIGIKDSVSGKFEENSQLNSETLTHYGKVKLFCENWANQNKPENLNLSVSRMFSFYGPHLPVSQNFAIGNFFRDVIQSRDIIIEGCGLSLRSYLSSYDLALALLKIATSGFSGPVNVGSDRAISILELADIFCAQSKSTKWVLSSDEKSESTYVPDTKILKDEIGFCETIGLEDGISKWLTCAGVKRKQ